MVPMISAVSYTHLKERQGINDGDNDAEQQSEWRTQHHKADECDGEGVDHQNQLCFDIAPYGCFQISLCIMDGSAEQGKHIFFIKKMCIRDRYRMPAHRETIRLETWSNKCRKMQAERGYYLFDEKGEKIADGMSRWIYMDFAKRKPTNVPDDMIEKYGTNQPPAIEGEKFRMPPMPEGEPKAQQRFTVTRRDTDTNGHANNVKYLEWALDDVPDEIYDGMTCLLYTSWSLRIKSGK